MSFTIDLDLQGVADGSEVCTVGVSDAVADAAGNPPAVTAVVVALRDRKAPTVALTLLQNNSAVLEWSEAVTCAVSPPCAPLDAVQLSLQGVEAGGDPYVIDASPTRWLVHVPPATTPDLSLIHI